MVSVYFFVIVLREIQIDRATLQK